MQRWNGKVAVVTGASSGIGAAVVIDLLNAGVNVVGLARREQRVKDLASKVSTTATGKLYAIKCDVSDEAAVKSAFQWVEENVGGVSILVNNAGSQCTTNLVDENNTGVMKEVVDTNLWGTVYCVREAFQSMKRHGIDGHLVLLNSILGQGVPYLVGQLPSFNIYPATKHAITAITEVLRQELQSFGTKTKVTSISPGIVRTEIFFPDQMEAMAKANVPFLEPADVSEAILYALGTPPHVQIHELVIKPIGEIW